MRAVGAIRDLAGNGPWYLGPLLVALGLLALVPLWQASTPAYDMANTAVQQAAPGLSVDPGLTVGVTTTTTTTTSSTTTTTTSSTTTTAGPTTTTTVAGPTTTTTAAPAALDLARTGPSTSSQLLAVLGAALLGAGVLVVRESRATIAAVTGPAWRHLSRRSPR